MLLVVAAAALAFVDVPYVKHGVGWGVGGLTDVFDRIETWYNRRRRHTSLGTISPLEYESHHHDGITVTNRRPVHENR